MGFLNKLFKPKEPDPAPEPRPEPELIVSAPVVAPPPKREPGIWHRTLDGRYVIKSFGEVIVRCRR